MPCGDSLQRLWGRRLERQRFVVGFTLEPTGAGVVGFCSNLSSDSATLAECVCDLGNCLADALKGGISGDGAAAGGVEVR